MSKKEMRYVAIMEDLREHTVSRNYSRARLKSWQEQWDIPNDHPAVLRFYKELGSKDQLELVTKPSFPPNEDIKPLKPFTKLLAKLFGAKHG